MLKFLRRRRAALLAAPAVIVPRHLGRRRTCDAIDPMAFTYRMPAGFAGVVSRSHPSSIEPVQPNAATPPLGFGLAVLDNGDNTIRQIAPGDIGVTAIYGVTVRPFPFQQTSGANLNANFNSGAPPTDQPLDVLTSGYILVPIFGVPTKGDPVFVWCAATTGGGVPGTDHIQGGFEAAATGGSTAALADTIGNLEFNGPPDANGIGELRFRI